MGDYKKLPKKQQKELVDIVKSLSTEFVIGKEGFKLKKRDNVKRTRNNKKS